MSWNIMVQIAVVVVALLGGAATVPVVKWMKNALNTSGWQTIALAAGVALILTMAVAVLDGVIAPGTVTEANFGAVFVTLFVAGQVRYRQLRDEMERGG
jgi:hypothetical protein